MLVINLWGGPGAGKSTLASELFVMLRHNTTGINVELTNEFATEICFERAKENLKDQPYLLGNQWHRLWRFAEIGVDVAISDSPIGIGIGHLENRSMPRYWENIVEPYIAFSRALRTAFPSVDVWIDRDVYSEGGFKGNTKKRNNNYLNQLDKRIQKECNPSLTVMFGPGAATSIYNHVGPKVIEYMNRKECS